ncbi:MAG: trypsin-like peptidase domain-containing protein [Planctomycetota bacterium]
MRLNQGHREFEHRRVFVGRNEARVAVVVFAILTATASLPALAQNESVNGSSFVSTSEKGNGETRVDVPPEIQSVFRRGEVPESLLAFRSLETQQKRIGELAEPCTVSVRIGAAQGSGVIITETGYIVTAAHVAMRPRLKAVVTLSNGRRVTATTLGMNREVDAGLIRIDPGQNGNQPWPHASLGTSDDLVPGMWCIAVGHPGGYDASRGPVLRVGRLLKVRRDVLVSDCALIGGDSGGPLFNFAGELIGVHSRIGNDVTDNLHVPINHYDHSWDRMKLGESWGFLPKFRPTLGVSGSQSSADASILTVKPGSPAQLGGIKVGDIVIQFGEKTISDFQSLKDAVAETMPGERLSVLVRRDGRVVKLVIEIGRAGDS